MSSFGVKLPCPKGCYWLLAVDHTSTLSARKSVDHVTK